MPINLACFTTRFARFRDSYSAGLSGKTNSRVCSTHHCALSGGKVEFHLRPSILNRASVALMRLAISLRSSSETAGSSSGRLYRRTMVRSSRSLFVVIPTPSIECLRARRFVSCFLACETHDTFDLCFPVPSLREGKIAHQEFQIVGFLHQEVVPFLLLSTL